jgi:hypothetical protein
MWSNQPLHNNLGARRKRETKQRRTITMNNPKPNRKLLLLENNHSENRNSHVSFVVMITTLEIAHIAMKWPNFSREIRNPPCLLSLFRKQQSLVAQTPMPGGSSNQPHDEASTSAHIYMFNRVNLTTCSTTYDTPVKLDKPKTANSSSPDPLPSSVNPPSVNPPSGPLQI